MHYYDYKKRVLRFDRPTCEICGMMEDLNYYYGECYELGWRGKHHCRILTNFGQLVAWGTKNIWEHLQLALDVKRRATQ